MIDFCFKQNGYFTSGEAGLQQFQLTKASGEAPICENLLFQIGPTFETLKFSYIILITSAKSFTGASNFLLVR